MRHVLTTILAIGMAGSLAGCQKAETPEATETTDAAAPDAQTGTVERTAPDEQTGTVERTGPAEQ
jgi:hypothetical protein